MAPALLIARAREVIEKLLFRYARLVLHDLILFQTPRNACGLWKNLADIMTVGTDHLIFIGEDGLEVQAISFLEGSFQQGSRHSKADEVVIAVGSESSTRHFQHIESEFCLYMRQLALFVSNRIS